MRNLPLKLTATLAVLGATAVATPATNAAPASVGEANGRSIPSVGITVQPDGTTTRLPVAGAAAPTSSVGGDPDLEPGFPVSTYERGGSYHAGPAINVLVGDLDRDRTLELCATALAVGPVSCWGHDGVPVDGWEWTRPPAGAGYFTMGRMRPLTGPTLVTATWGGLITAENRAGQVRPGWPIEASNYISTPPSMGVFSRRQSAVVLEEEDWYLHAYLADADIPPGWPTGGSDGGQERHTPAITDVDGERGREVVSASGWMSSSVNLFVDHVDGTSVEGYPVRFPGEVDTFPAVGDVDDDGTKEIVVVGTDPADPFWSAVYVYEATTGRLEGMRRLSGGVPYVTAPALAQLDGACGVEGGLLEIVVQTEPTIEVITWNGTTFHNRAGFPKTWHASQWIGDSSPAVGDVDGDQSPDIVFTGQYAGQGINGSVYAYSASGAALSGFPKQVEIGSGGMPAIADVDRDGRNEIAIKGSPWDGSEGPKPTLWLYDLGGSDHGRIEWSQFMHDAAHRGAYATPRCPAS